MHIKQLVQCKCSINEAYFITLILTCNSSVSLTVGCLGESHSVSRPEWKSDAFCVLQVLTHCLLLVLMLSPLAPTFLNLIKLKRGLTCQEILYL